MSRRSVNVISLSFLDLMSLGLGAVILLMVIFVSLMKGKREHNRQFVFTVNVQFTRPKKDAGADTTPLALALLTRQELEPAEFFEPVLYDPNGVEHRPYMTAKIETRRPITFSHRQPTAGVWRLHLRARKELPALPDGAGAVSLSVPPAIRYLQPTYDRIRDQAPTARAAKTELGELIRRLQPTRRVGLDATRHDLTVVNDLLPSYFRPDSRARVEPNPVGDDSAARARAILSLCFPDARDDDTPEAAAVRRATWEPLPDDFVAHALAAAALATVCDAWLEQSRDRENTPLLGSAFGALSRHLKATKRSGLARTAAEQLQEIEREAFVGHALRAWDRKSPRLKTHIRESFADPPPPPGDNAQVAPALKTAAVTLATAELRPDMVKRLRELCDRLLKLDVSPSPVVVLFLIDTFAASGTPDDFQGVVNQLIKRLGDKPEDVQRRLTEHANLVPGLYFAAHRAAVGNAPLGVTLEHLFLHSGSQVIYHRTISVGTTTLTAAEPVIEFAVHPDGVELVNPRP